MDNHPIPQDITGFQFKLIGEMTVKQFAYLAVGVVLGWIFLFVLSSLPLIVRLPLGLFFAGFGTALAFLPLEGRPMDIMVMNFVLSLTRPNQYLFHKENHPLLQIYQTIKTPTKKQQEAPKVQSAPKYTNDQLSTMLQSISHRPRNKWDQKELLHLQSLGFTTKAAVPSLPKQPLPPMKQSQVSQITPPLPAPQIVKPSQAAKQITKVQLASVLPKQPLTTNLVTPTQNMQNTFSIQKSSIQTPQNPLPPPQIPKGPLKTDEKDVVLQANINNILQTSTATVKENEQVLTTSTSAANQAKITQENEQNAELAKSAHEKATELEHLLNDQTIEKQKLENELIALKKQLSTQKQQVFTPSKSAPVQKQTANVHVIDKSSAKAAGLPVPEAANLLTGIVKDARGNPLPNILIEVKNADGSPVRAFKTNMLGIFASATALSNGIYTIEFEDTSNQHKFDAVQIEANGEVVFPLEVTSTDAREELRKSLFGAPAQ